MNNLKDFVIMHLITFVLFKYIIHEMRLFVCIYNASAIQQVHSEFSVSEIKNKWILSVMKIPLGSSKKSNQSICVYLICSGIS